MKKKSRNFILVFLAVCTSFTTTLIGEAQQINPATWGNFVKTASNRIVCDTFMMQTFTENPENNWAYQVAGKTSFFTGREEFADASDGLALKLEPGSQLRMNDVPDYGSYDNPLLKVIYAVRNLAVGENLLVSADRASPIKNHVWLSPTDNYSASFQENKTVSWNQFNFVLIQYAPLNICLDIKENPENTYNGFYAVDSAFVYGVTKEYSLFTGEGRWSDFARWTHNPALRHRHAMINGKAAVDGYVTCNQLFIGDGTVHIEENRQLKAQKIHLCSDNAFLSSKGSIEVEDSLIVYRTFEEKGVWYFISFPFDVYLNGIDPAFTLGDETPNAGGNYFYLRTYNGEKRSVSQTARGNWEVVSAAAVPPDQPVFKKNKGYLIALDQLANKQTLRFSAKGADIAPGFGKNGTISIQAGTPVRGETDKDYGWYLCGNPLPAPLPLAAIEANNCLDGNIYIYNGSDFEQYPLNSDYALAPFSAFFVKASRDTEVQISAPNISLANNNIIYTSRPLTATKAEPEPLSPSVTATSSPNMLTPNSYICVNSLFIEDLLMPGAVYLVDPMGRLIWKKEVDAGSSVVNLPSTLKKGIYFIRLETILYKAQHKFILSQ